MTVSLCLFLHILRLPQAREMQNGRDKPNKIMFNGRLSHDNKDEDNDCWGVRLRPWFGEN